MPIDEAKDLFSLLIDVWDQKSLKAYFGTHAHREVQKINERKQYHSGTVVQATIELSHDVKTKEGYLERLGLVHYEQRGKTVFMVLENAPLVPELMKSRGSNDNFSPPLEDFSHKGKGAGGNRFVKVSPLRIVAEKEKRESIQGEREIGRVELSV
jgi:hypothetical protein